MLYIIYNIIFLLAIQDICALKDLVQINVEVD